MEKRIKTLYIITIIAILSFLGMQIYWLYTRYDLSLYEYEVDMSQRITNAVNEYNEIRKLKKQKDEAVDKDNVSFPSFTLQQSYGDTVKTVRTTRIYTYSYSAHQVLGLDPDVRLTDELMNEAITKIRQIQGEPSDSVVYDASGARDENEAWAAAQNVQTEQKHRFTEEGVDSVLKKEGIKAEIVMAKADSMVWNPKINFHRSIIKPEVSVMIPYSQLEGRTVTVNCRFSVLDVLPGLSPTFLIVLLISVLLIVCLILQFSTVLKLSRLDKMRNSFVTTMIHELKRPISTLKMCVSGMENEKMMEDKETKRELMAEARNALDNLSAYFSKLRDITFNNVDQIPLNIQSINLHELFDIVSEAVTVPADKSVIVDNEIGDDVEVSVDRSHLYNILTNLVENAVKYSGEEVKITASAEVDGAVVEIRVKDNGNGIPQGDINHIFQRFYRGKASVGEQPGMGLGLAYVKLLVEAHGGEIAVESAEGKGSCFIIRLPQ